jgi:hypothetical protein
MLTLTSALRCDRTEYGWYSIPALSDPSQHQGSNGKKEDSVRWMPMACPLEPSYNLMLTAATMIYMHNMTMSPLIM